MVLNTCLVFIRHFRTPTMRFLARAFYRTITALNDGSNWVAGNPVCLEPRLHF
jgi:hypothetical protein